MTRPYKRACHQTNFSKGGFVKKESFSFFHFLFKFYVPFFHGHFFHCIFLRSGGCHSVGPLAAGGSSANIVKMK